jgi:hypothetical protein
VSSPYRIDNFGLAHDYQRYAGVGISKSDEFSNIFAPQF